MKELLKEIEAVKESIRQEKDNYYQETLKYGKHSTASADEHAKELMRLENYLKGLEVAKIFLEKEGK